MLVLVSCELFLLFRVRSAVLGASCSPSPQCARAHADNGRSLRSRRTGYVQHRSGMHYGALLCIKVCIFVRRDSAVVIVKMLSLTDTLREKS